MFRSLSWYSNSKAHSGYRDRASERRNELNKEELQLEEIVSKLDAEQTKYLGGDIDHTHFVRGLDYALLQKIRAATERESKQNEEEEVDNSQENEIKNINDLVTSSTLGANIHFLLTSKTHTSIAKKAESVLIRTYYEFDLSTPVVDEGNVF